MNTNAIRTGVIIGGALLVVGVAVFFLGSDEVVAPTEENGVAVSDTETANPATGEETAVLPTEGTDVPPATTPTPAPQPKPTTTTAPVVTTPKPTATQPQATYGALIVYTDTGFKPSRVTITEGQTVRFLNQSDREMWVASNIHPVHTNYQERSNDGCSRSTFDQCESVGTGAYWDFKFNLVGSWDFHNHMRATDDGEVTVLARE